MFLQVISVQNFFFCNYRRETEHEVIGKYDLPLNRFVSCQFTERNNLTAVSVF